MLNILRIQYSEFRIINKSAILLITVLVLISGCGFANISPNSFEGAYISIAVDINAPELCYKINPNSVTYAGGAGVPFGLTTTSTRYECFYDVAVQTHDIDLCKQVRTIYNGGTITQANCEREAAERKYRASISIGMDEELILRLLGYNDEEVMKLKGKNRTYFDLYLIERKKPEFRTKLAVLPDFSVSDYRAKKELYALAPECIEDVSNNPLCFRIKCGLVRGKLERSCWQK